MGFNTCDGRCQWNGEEETRLENDRQLDIRKPCQVLLDPTHPSICQVARGPTVGLHEVSQFTAFGGSPGHRERS